MYLWCCFLFQHNMSVSDKHWCDGGVCQCTWMFKCLNFFGILNQIFVQDTQTVHLLFMRLRDVSVELLRDAGKRSVHTRMCLYCCKNHIWFQGGGFICLTNQGYTERQRITHPISVFALWVTLIGCSVIWMTRSKGDGREVLIKSHWWYDPNSACPVISLLTKNHYIRCQSGSIFWQGEVPSFPSPSPKPVHWLQTLSNKRDEVKDLFKSAPPSPQPRQGESLFVCWGRLYQRGIIKFLLTAYCA